jgi:hypothetical protein
LSGSEELNESDAPKSDSDPGLRLRFRPPPEETDPLKAIGSDPDSATTVPVATDPSKRTSAISHNGHAFSRNLPYLEFV